MFKIFCSIRDNLKYLRKRTCWIFVKLDVKKQYEVCVCMWRWVGIEIKIHLLLVALRVFKKEWDTQTKMEYFGQSSISLSAYRDQKFKGTETEQKRLLAQSTTLYVGNLSFYTTEEQIHELFSRAGDIKRVIMGLNKNTKTPCGFCFVEYYSRADAENAMRYINGTRLDDRLIRTDWDAGFVEGRQYGRGKSGGQVCLVLLNKWVLSIYILTVNLFKVRDEYRKDFDPGRLWKHLSCSFVS